MKESMRSTPFAEISISASLNKGINRQVPSAKMPRNLLFSSSEVNSDCVFHSGNGFVSRTLPLFGNQFVYSLKPRGYRGFLDIICSLNSCLTDLSYIRSFCSSSYGYSSLNSHYPDYIHIRSSLDILLSFPVRLDSKRLMS